MGDHESRLLAHPCGIYVLSFTNTAGAGAPSFALFAKGGRPQISPSRFRCQIPLECRRVLFVTRSAASSTSSPSVVTEDCRFWARLARTRSSNESLKRYGCGTDLWWRDMC